MLHPEKNKAAHLLFWLLMCNWVGKRARPGVLLKLVPPQGTSPFSRSSLKRIARLPRVGALPAPSLTPYKNSGKYGVGLTRDPSSVGQHSDLHSEGKRHL